MSAFIKALLVFCFWCGVAKAAPGDSAERSFTLGATQVPLPQGRWVVAADHLEMSGKIRAVVLVQIHEKIVRGVIVARSNPVPTTSIFGTTSECERIDSYLAYTVYDTPQDGLCAFANLVITGRDEPPVWVQARTWLKEQGISLGQDWLMVGLRARVRPYVLDTRYYFPVPDASTSLSWADNPWNPNQVTSNPQRNAMITQLRLWAAWMRDPVATGVRGRVEDIDFPPVLTQNLDVLPLLIDARMNKLDALHAWGYVDLQEYTRQKKILMEIKIAPERAEMSLSTRSAWKTLTYRVASVADALVVSYAVLGSVTQTISFSLIGELIRPPAVYLHEMLWARSGIGRPAASGRPQEFAEIGVDR